MRRLTAVSLLILLLVETTGCHNWQPDTRPLPAIGSGKPGEFYRITLASGRVVEVTNVRLHGDSLLATTDSGKVVRGSVEYAMVPIGFPVQEVTRVERRSVNAAGRVVAALLITG